ncbi:MAG: nitroreductase family protein [Clostridia bacterium]|nr:nitroreductase family protein [Clostridia bacterium]
MEFNEVIKTRWSVRSFSDKKVEQDKLLRILETAKTAPTAKNMQPVRIICAQSDKALADFKRISPCTYGAPLIFAVCSDENKCWVSSDGESRGEMDASIYATHIMLAAANEGLGSCWVCMFDRNELVRRFELPENIVPRCLVVVGYSSEDAQPSDRHFDRLPLSETVRYV